MMQSQHIPMTMDEFHRLPFRPGWKMEYWAGQAHIRPRDDVAVGRLRCDSSITPPQPDPSFELVPLLEIEPHEFVPGFIAAFQEVPEYCDWEQECFEQEAREVVQDFFAGRRGRPLPASRAAVISRGPDAGRVAGAAMVVALKNGDALLDVLWVVPGWQHQGLATQMLKHVQALLAEASCNTLASIWHLANQSSIAWHLKSGFTEQRDLALARLYAQAAEHELWLQRDSLTREQAQVLQAKARYYRDEADDLEKAMLNGGEASAFAIFRIERDRENPAESEFGVSKHPNEV